MNIMFWKEEAFIPPLEEYKKSTWDKRVKWFHNAEDTAMVRKLGQSPDLVRHRFRQAMFYERCTRDFMGQGRHWTLFTDVDEFLHINYEIVNNRNANKAPNATIVPPPVSEEGNVGSFVRNQMQKEVESSPCLSIPRHRYGGVDSPDHSSALLVKKTARLSTKRSS